MLRSEVNVQLLDGHELRDTPRNKTLGLRFILQKQVKLEMFEGESLTCLGRFELSLAELSLRLSSNFLMAAGLGSLALLTIEFTGRVKGCK